MKYTQQNKIKWAREILLTVENMDGKVYFVKKKAGSYLCFPGTVREIRTVANVVCFNIIIMMEVKELGPQEVHINAE